MKSLIVPITIIIGLFAFLVIVDRKEFSRHDDVQTVQSESPTSNRKPTVSVPEKKSVTEVKPVAETKSDKPAETTPEAETKPKEKLQPATVPVVTLEEAEKLNEEAKEFALAEKEK